MMAVDKLVDSTQLDSDLTSVANAIRAKSGGSNQLAFPAGFVSEIGNIPSGGTQEIKGVISVGLYSETETELNAKLPNLNSLTLPINNAFSVVTADITPGSSEITINSGCNAQNKGGALKTLNLHMAKALFPNTASGLRYRKNLEEVYAKIRVLLTNVNNQFTGATKLKTIFWQENKQTIAVKISDCPLTEESLVSLANGLSGTTTATLTLSSSKKTLCNSIMGTVSQVTDGGDTYDFFTQDDSGTVTLADFITNTKGWTLA